MHHHPARWLTVLALGALALWTMPVAAWWDTLIPTWRPVPLVKEFPAAELVQPQAVVQNDAEANGAQGGKIAVLKPGGPGLSVVLDPLQPQGIYALFVIARCPEGPPGNALFTLELTEQATGKTRSWTVISVHRESYFAVAQIYFPTHAGGRYTAVVKMAEKLPQLPADPIAKALFVPETLQLKAGNPPQLYVDRLELRDALANCAKRAAKTRRMLTSDEELAKLRRQFQEEYPQRKDRRLSFGQESYVLVAGDRGCPAWWPAGRAPAERQARNDELWLRLPDFNDPVSHDYGSPYSTIIGRDRPGLIVDAARLYEQTGHAEFGWDGAVLLCGLAERFPALDYFAQGMGGYTNVMERKEGPPFTFNRPPGKSVYRGWAGSDMERLAIAYDQLFDFIKGNRELAAYVGTRIPWVKTPADVIKLVDTNLLQAGIDEGNRTYIAGSDGFKALLALVQGVNPVGDQMLAGGLFRSMDMNMTYRGGIDDQAICSYSRDGVHYIGSVGYLTQDLQGIAELLHRYRLAGGNPRFDLLDPVLYPQMNEAQATLNAVHVAGGFPLVTGDATDLRVGRKPHAGVTYRPLPSRVLGGFGLAVLESGSPDEPLKQRAVAVHTGIGRGHAHQDTLNLDLLAHGCRMAPDLGGRHEGTLTGKPNMRWNRVHNLVEVDQRNFENTYPGSTTSATGWCVAFSPAPEAQFMDLGARATSHPEVTTYARQLALIDVDERNSYVFDVFRVAGGSVHTYCFHGCPTANLQINAPLQPAASDVAKAYLVAHFAGTAREAPCPPALQADWALDPPLQQSYQGAAFEKDRQPVTRLHLLGQAGALLLVGNAWSDPYHYNFPFLYVRREAPAPASSVFPAVVELYAGQPFITETRLLAVTADPAPPVALAPTALEVRLANGRTDCLFANAQPATAAKVGETLEVTGRFACVSRDAAGLRLAHLVGGTVLRGPDFAILPAQATWADTIATVDYGARTATIKAKWPAALLRGAVAGMDNGSLVHNFCLEEVKPGWTGTRLCHEKTARYYQSRVVHVDVAAGTVETEIEPVVFGSDTRFPEGTTVSNEAGTKHWKATLLEGDRWMNLSFPGYRGSWPDRITWDDVPDHDGDGRRTLTVLGLPNDKDANGKSLADQPLLQLDVTRITPDHETFYFRLPANPDYQRGGWQYANRWLVNENRSRRWLAMYPGSSFHWRLAAGVKAGDFTDANGDGQTKLTAEVFGPGDEVRIETFVWARRGEGDQWEVRANVPCHLALPRAGCATVEVLDAKGKGRSLPVTATATTLEVGLDAATLGAGAVTLQLRR